jgi:hypothetical protein
VLIVCAVAYPLVLALWRSADTRLVDAVALPPPYPAAEHTTAAMSAGGNCGPAVTRDGENGIELDGEVYSVLTAWHDPEVGFYYPAADACNRVVAFKGLRELASGSLGDGAALRGRLCDVDGTPEGLLWWSLGADPAAPGGGETLWTWRPADPAGDGPARMPFADFMDQFRMCRGAEADRVG